MIGKILKTMRKIKGLKQSELAILSNIPQNTISQYETSKIQPTFETINKIANVCDFDIVFTDKKNNLTPKNIDRKEL